ncbi:hypothetical protein H0H92_008231, partial [Tricholoma furcatifolium]
MPPRTRASIERHLNNCDRFKIVTLKALINFQAVTSFVHFAPTTMSNPHDTRPPGLDGDLTHVVSGGTTSDWKPLKTTKNFTNAFIIKDGKALSQHTINNRYNGFGGKVEPGETFQQAAVRELKEEAGITAPLEYAGTLLFTTDGANDFAFNIEVYRADEYTGTVTETDEMRPEWFALPSADSQASNPTDNLPSIPYDK